MSEELIREVDEEVKRDRLQSQMKRYGPFIVAAVVVVVAAAAAGAWWVDFQEQRQQQRSDQFAQATVLASEGRVEEALEAFGELADSGSSGYRVLAGLRQASLLVELGDNEAAVAIYDEIASTKGVEPQFRDMAIVLGAMNALDDGDPAALTERLAPLTAENSAWRYSARELTALLAMRMGEEDRAVELLLALADDLAAPSGIRARAAELLAALGQ